MTRILMTSDAVGGVWTYTLELVRALASHRVEATIALLGPSPSQSQLAEFQQLDNATLAPGPAMLEWMDDPWAGVDAAADWLLNLADETQPDLVHLNGYVHAALPWKVPVVVVAHSCVATWWRNVLAEPIPPQFGEYLRRVREGLLAADQVIAPTQAFRDELQTEYRVSVPGETIFNARTQRRFRVGEKAPMIFSAGRVWDSAKNLRLLTKIAPELDWPVSIAGDSGNAEFSEQDVTWLGPLPSTRLAEVLEIAAIYAAPARYEPFGLAILEAALSGCALVLSDLPTLRELWEGCATFVPAEDEEGWIRALNEMARDHDLLRRQRSRARIRALEFSPERQAAAYAGVYRKLLTPHHVLPVPLDS